MEEKGLHELKADLLKSQDAVLETLKSAAAIIDCVRVLAALERMPTQPFSQENGCGYVNGNRVRDESMSLALYHAAGLITEAHESSTEIFKNCIAILNEKTTKCANT